MSKKVKNKLFDISDTKRTSFFIGSFFIGMASLVYLYPKVMFSIYYTIILVLLLVIIDVFVIITTGLLQIPNIGVLLALRIIQGVIVGIFMAIVPLYMNELVPMDLHGSEGVISQVLIVFGYVINYILICI